MKLHESLSDRQKEEIIEIAKQVGLDKIKYEETYFVTKVDQVKQNPNGLPDGGLIIIGEPTVLGPIENELVLLFVDKNNPINWLRTSPVKNVIKNGNSLYVQTANSTYLLQTSLDKFRDQL